MHLQAFKVGAMKIKINNTALSFYDAMVAIIKKNVIPNVDKDNNSNCPRIIVLKIAFYLVCLRFRVFAKLKFHLKTTEDKQIQSRYLLPNV